MAMIRSKSAHQWLILMLVSVLLDGRCSAQVPTTAAATSMGAYPPRHELGVMIDTAYSINGGVWAPCGVRITAVIPGSPAQQSGLGAGDIITTVNGWRVTTPQVLQWAIANSGGRVTLLGQKAGIGTPFQIPALSLLSQPVAVTPFSFDSGPYAQGAPASGQASYYAPQATPKTVPTAPAPAAPAKSYPTGQGTAPYKSYPTGQGTAPTTTAPAAPGTTAPAAPGTDVVPPAPPAPYHVPPHRVPT